MIRAITTKKTLLTSFAFISKNKTSHSSPDKYSLTSSLTRKKISYHKSKPRILCLKKTVSLRKSFQSKFPSIIQKNLSKYNTTPTKYNTSIITSIIFDENTHLVSTFKDFLYWAGMLWKFRKSPISFRISAYCSTLSPRRFWMPTY